MANPAWPAPMTTVVVRTQPLLPESRCDHLTSTVTLVGLVMMS
jgi:hypothetical protein